MIKRKRNSKKQKQKSTQKKENKSRFCLNLTRCTKYKELDHESTNAGHKNKGKTQKSTLVCVEVMYNNRNIYMGNGKEMRYEG